MSDDWNHSFDQVKNEALALQSAAYNRNDKDFAPWHRKARSVLLKYAPVKIPAFDEIRFASDFFLSQPGEKQDTINDSIAISEDLDLAIDLFEQAARKIESDLRYQKRRGDMGKMTVEPIAESMPVPADAQTPGTGTMADLRGLLDSLDLTSREKDDALEELERLEKTLASAEPDWDRVKRSIKFLLDFDRTLAIRAVPWILQRLQ